MANFCCVKRVGLLKHNVGVVVTPVSKSIIRILMKKMGENKIKPILVAPVYLPLRLKQQFTETTQNNHKNILGG